MIMAYLEGSELKIGSIAKDYHLKLLWEPTLLQRLYRSISSAAIISLCCTLIPCKDLTPFAPTKQNTAEGSHDTSVIVLLSLLYCFEGKAIRMEAHLEEL